jgi:hypothetical protein
MPPKMAEHSSGKVRLLPSLSRLVVPMVWLAGASPSRTFCGAVCQKQSNGWVIFLLIVIPICPRIQVKGSGNVAGFSRAKGLRNRFSPS